MGSQVVTEAGQESFVQDARSEGIEFIGVENRETRKDAIIVADGMVNSGVVLVYADRG